MNLALTEEEQLVRQTLPALFGKKSDVACVLAPIPFANSAAAARQRDLRRFQPGHSFEEEA